MDCEILSILRQRHEHCVHEDHNQRAEAKCNSIYEVYEQNAANWFAKCKFEWCLKMLLHWFRQHAFTSLVLSFNIKHD